MRTRGPFGPGRQSPEGEVASAAASGTRSDSGGAQGISLPWLMQTTLSLRGHLFQLSPLGCFTHFPRLVVGKAPTKGMLFGAGGELRAQTTGLVHLTLTFCVAGGERLDLSLPPWLQLQNRGRSRSDLPCHLASAPGRGACSAGADALGSGQRQPNSPFHWRPWGSSRLHRFGGFTLSSRLSLTVHCVHL